MLAGHPSAHINHAERTGQRRRRWLAKQDNITGGREISIWPIYLTQSLSGHLADQLDEALASARPIKRLTDRIQTRPVETRSRGEAEPRPSRAGHLKATKSR